MDKYLELLKKEDDKKTSALKIIFITLGVITATVAAAAIVYNIFKKYFTITFECGDCDNCDESCFDEEDDSDTEPLCCCDEDDAGIPEENA